VAAGNQAARLVDLVIAAPQHLVDRLRGHFLGDAHQVQRQLRLPAHGVDVAEGVGGGNLAEEVGVVGDRREKVYRLHQGQLVGDLVDRRVVALVKPHQQLGVAVDLDALQELGQHAGPYLGPAAGAAGQLCQLYRIFHIVPPLG
jgi:hypothetical protein